MPGVENTDLHIYYRFTDNAYETYSTYSSICVVTLTYRPVFAVLNFNKNYYDNVTFTDPL